VKLWKFLLLLVSLAVVGGALILTVNFLVLPSIIHSNQVVSTPDIRGMSVTGAETQLRQFQLEVEAIRERAHPTIPEGMILDQIPAPQTGIRGGRTVKVVISSGPAAGGVPQLAGLTLRQAEITLQRENFRLGRVLRIRRTGVSQPVVDFQSPDAGTELYKGAIVDLVIAEPAAMDMLRMPDLRGMPLYQARQVISGAGFVLGPVTFERSRDTDPNLILEQTPRAGTRVRKGDQLELVASSR